MGNLSVAAVKSKEYTGASPKGTLLRGLIWLKVPSVSCLDNILNKKSCNPFKVHCVIQSTIANTLIFPAGSSLMDNFPKKGIKPMIDFPILILALGPHFLEAQGIITLSVDNHSFTS